MTTEERLALKRWREFHEMIQSDIPMEHRNVADMEKHLLYLEKHPVEWIKFFFPEYAKYEFAPFQIRTINRCLKRDEWYEVLSWARSLAKSTIVMFIVLYLVFTGRKKNIIMTSATQDAAVRLLDPYKKELEGNARIRAYYGSQLEIGKKWTDSEFITSKNAAFRAIGANNAPRGTRNKADRPDVLLVDDFDTDEACRNTDRINDQWTFWEKAVYGTRDPAVPLLVIFCGNIIARDCCITRAGAIADHWDIVNIRDKEGNSVWPEKNTEEQIDHTLSKITVSAQQSEYYNNPVTEGEIFKELQWGKVPPLSKFKFLVCYGDPAPGENKSKGSSTKTIWLVGELEGVFYIIKGFLNRGLNSDFIDWYFILNQWVDGKTTIYNFIENNSLQDPFFRQVFQPLLQEKKREKNYSLSIIPDEDKKTDKATRIEANLEPINREGKLILNIAEKDNPDMQRLADQFSLFTLRLKFPADGPDCIEGAKRIIDRKKSLLTPPVKIKVKSFRVKNKYRL